MVIAGTKREDLNGQSCHVVSFDEPSGRWLVELADGTMLKLVADKLADPHCGVAAPVASVAAPPPPPGGGEGGGGAAAATGVEGPPDQPPELEKKLSKGQRKKLQAQRAKERAKAELEAARAAAAPET